MGHMGQFAKIWDNMGHFWEIWDIWEIWDSWEACGGFGGEILKVTFLNHVNPWIFCAGVVGKGMALGGGRRDWEWERRSRVLS